MTTVVTPPVEWAPRSEVEVLRDQLAAIDRWHRAREAFEGAARAEEHSREMRMDVGRRLEVLRAQHSAIVERSERQLRDTARVLDRLAPRRAIVVHRHPWFGDKLCAELADRRIEVVSRLESGAEAVGAAVAEQPDLMLVEETLPMLSGEEVVREVRQYSPLTVVAAQVAHDDRIEAMLEAGAAVAFPRRVPPTDVAHELARLLAPAAS